MLNTDNMIHIGIPNFLIVFHLTDIYQRIMYPYFLERRSVLTKDPIRTKMYNVDKGTNLYFYGLFDVILQKGNLPR